MGLCCRCFILLCTLLYVVQYAAGRVVQLVAENPSTFVSADPNDPQYLVALLKDAAKASLVPEVPLERSTIMTDAAGLRYNCSIPEAPSDTRTALGLQQQAPADASLVKSPFELLDSLTGLCLYRQDGLWTYEICHRKHVRQFRQVKLDPDNPTIIDLTGDEASLDGFLQAMLSRDVAAALGEVNKLLGGQGTSSTDAGRGGEDFSCGQYEGDDKQDEAILEGASSSGHYMKYVSHTYKGGASCLLTGAPRTAEVRYICGRDSQENVVLSVREFPTCNYVVVVSTPFLCKHPELVPPVQDVRLISCSPLDAPEAPSKDDLSLLGLLPADASADVADAKQDPPSSQKGPLDTADSTAGSTSSSSSNRLKQQEDPDAAQQQEKDSGQGVPAVNSGSSSGAAPAGDHDEL